MTDELKALREENSKLRVLLAKSNLACIYCGRKEMSECPSGFPGCARMDDLMADPSFAEEYANDP
jgi:hypothetical protein